LQFKKLALGAGLKNAGYSEKRGGFSNRPSGYGKDFPALDARFFLMLVIELEFGTAATWANVLHLSVEALPRFFRIAVNPLPTLVENKRLSLRPVHFIFRFFKLEFSYLVARASGAEGTPFETEIAVEAELHVVFLLKNF